MQFRHNKTHGRFYEVGPLICFFSVPLLAVSDLANVNLIALFSCSQLMRKLLCNYNAPYLSSAYSEGAFWTEKKTRRTQHIPSSCSLPFWIPSFASIRLLSTKKKDRFQNPSYFTLVLFDSYMLLFHFIHAINVWPPYIHCSNYWNRKCSFWHLSNALNCNIDFSSHTSSSSIEFF